MRQWCQELTLEAGLRTQLVGGMHLCTDNDARRQETASAAGCCVGEKKNGTLSYPLFYFSALLTNLSPRWTQISIRKLLAGTGRKLLTFTSC